MVCLPAAAGADGDPASDVLISDTLFLPYQPPSGGSVTKLRRAIDALRKAGQPVRVAIIGSQQDLGAVANLYGHPREYARLLGQELGNPVEAEARGHREELIVVMEAGYGTNGVSPAVERELRAVELPSGASPDELAAAAGYGVQVLARSTGRRLPVEFEKPKAGGGGGALTAVLVIAALLVLVALLIALRVRSARQAEPIQSPGGNA